MTDTRRQTIAFCDHCQHQIIHHWVDDTRVQCDRCNVISTARIVTLPDDTDPAPNRDLAYFTATALSGIGVDGDMLTAIYEAQNSCGSDIEWTRIGSAGARGTFRGAGRVNRQRVAIADRAQLTAVDALALADWVAGNIA